MPLPKYLFTPARNDEDESKVRYIGAEYSAKNTFHFARHKHSHEHNIYTLSAKVKDR